MSKIQSPKSIINNGLWNFGFNVWTIFFTLLTTPFIVKQLGNYFYGIYALLISVSGLLGFLNLGLGEATIRYISYYYGKNDVDGINRSLGSTLFVYMITGIIGFMTLFFGSNFIASKMAIDTRDFVLVVKLLKFTSINLFLSFFLNTYTSVPQALQRYDISTKINIIQNIIYCIGIFLLIFLKLDITFLVFWMIAVNIITIVITLLIIKSIFPEIKILPKFSSLGLKEVYGYGIFSFINQILSYAYYEGDRLLLGALTSATSVSYYSVPQNIAVRAGNVVSNTFSILFPKFSSIDGKEGEEGDTNGIFLKSTYLSIIFSILIFCPIIILFPFFLNLWISPEFSLQSRKIGQIVALGVMLRGAFYPFYYLFRGKGKPQYITLFLTVTSITSLSIVFILIPKYGLLGAGYSFLISAIWGFLTLLLAWVLFLKNKSILPLIKSVFVPICTAFLYNFCLTRFTTNVAIDNWWVLIGAGVIVELGIVLLLVVLEFLYIRNLDLCCLLSKAKEFINKGNKL